jgi:hypothetical protein
MPEATSLSLSSLRMRHAWLGLAFATTYPPADYAMEPGTSNAYVNAAIAPNTMISAAELDRMLSGLRNSLESIQVCWRGAPAQASQSREGRLTDWVWVLAC